MLDAVPDAVFGFLRPKRVIMTTPNAEYNVLFPGFTGFRHHDHKFEWTRKQFQTWYLCPSPQQAGSVVLVFCRCDGVCSMYGYTVEYGGVGEPPPDRAEVGYCSQMATFTSGGAASQCNAQPSIYKVVRCIRDIKVPSSVVLLQIAEANHPYREDTRSQDEKLRVECIYYLNVLFKCRMEAEGESYDEVCPVPLKQLLVFPKVRELCGQEDAVQDIR